LGVFTLCAIFFKLTEVAQIFGQLFFPRFKSCIDFDKSCMGYILGDFIWNTSGHPCDIKSLLSDRCYKNRFSLYIPIAIYFRQRLSSTYACT
jgi:hypothetical protein